MNSIIVSLKKFIMNKKRSRKSILLSAVVILEVIAILTVSTFAWVETVSSIKIINEPGGYGEFDDFLYTKVAFSDALNGTQSVLLSDYFKRSGDMHLAPISSPDGKDFYFPNLTANANNQALYRKGNTSDSNVNYVSVAFEMTSNVTSDFYFSGTPTISNDHIRLSVTSMTKGGNDPQTVIYGKDASDDEVVNTRQGGTTQVHVESISDHTDTSDITKALFSISKTETKIITINVWLQKLADTDLTTNLSEAIDFDDLSIVSSLSPRKITLVPTGYWNSDNPWYAAYVFGGSAGESAKWINLSSGSTADYALTDNNDGSYSFYLKGKYTRIIFARMRTGYSHSTVPAFPANYKYSGTDMWNKTIDLTIPTEETNMHPTFIVGSTGTTNAGATGSWEKPATVKVDYVTGYTNGTIGLTCDTNNIRTGICQVVTKAATTITSTQTANQNYAFVGWYTNAEGTGTAVQTITTAPAAGETVTYYAKFVRTYTVTMKSVNRNGTETTSLGTMTMTAGGTSATSNGTVSTFSRTYPVGTTITFSAAGNTNNGFLGIYTTQTGNTEISQLTVTEDTTVYARYTDKQTVYIGLVKHENYTSTDFKLHYWNSSTNGDADLTDMSTEVDYAVGSSYWNNEEKTYTMYSAEIPYNATDMIVMKNYSGIGNDSTISSGNCLLIFHYDNAIHSVQKTYPKS